MFLNSGVSRVSRAIVCILRWKVFVIADPRLSNTLLTFVIMLLVDRFFLSLDLIKYTFLRKFLLLRTSWQLDWSWDFYLTYFFTAQLTFTSRVYRCGTLTYFLRSDTKNRTWRDWTNSCMRWVWRRTRAPGGTNSCWRIWTSSPSMLRLSAKKPNGWNKFVWVVLFFLVLSECIFVTNSWNMSDM